MPDPLARPLGQILTDLAAADPHAAAITFEGDTWSRQDLESAANRRARHFAELGVRRGDYVTVALANKPSYFATVFAVWKLGAVPQLISPRLPAPERSAVLRLARPRLVVGAAEPGLPAAPDEDALSAEFSDAPFDHYPVAPAWKAPTSGGTTGRPKLIVSGQAGLLDVAPLNAVLGQRPDDVQLVSGPLYHNAPFNTSFFGLMAGQHLVILPKFEARTALRAIARHRVSWLTVVPTMMSRMLTEVRDRPKDYDLGSVRRLWHMAAPCPPWLKRAWIELLGAEKIYEMYGGTENQMMTLIDGRDWLTHPGSVGRAVFGEFVVLDADGCPCPPGMVGEIFMRPAEGDGPSYRYVGAEPRTHANWPGWDSLGDLGHVDDEGFLYLSDRRTDLIVTGGANVFPAEVEAVITEYPGVRGCAVVGLPDDDLGRRVHAVVETDAPLDEARLRGHVESRLVRYKCPRTYRFTDTPLRDDAGKLRRAELLDLEARLTSRATGSAT
ncbi:AMP-binding protein [Nocardia sp. NPDC051929]|uniref:AMP-binding protein n=1 Tax=Nocardia sp. NPDC051929 TaxID=3364327 RepID=UPI0037C72BC0